MAKNFKKYYPMAAKKSPYVILEPDEYSAMMSEENVTYADVDIAKIKSFSRLAKFIIIAWMLGVVFLLVQQNFYREPISETSNSIIRKISYYFDTDNQKVSDDVVPICLPGSVYKPDGCNSCICDNNGQPAECTKMACPHDSEDPFKVVI